MRLLVSATGPILRLHESDALELLPLAGQVVIPPAVDGDLSRLVSSWAAHRPDWLLTKSLTRATRRAAHGSSERGILDPVEAEAVSLARQVRTESFLTDDPAARIVATRMGFEVHGSLGVVLRAAAAGHLDRQEALETLEGLFRSSLWISPDVRAEAKAALDSLSES